jgi:hypothetical protein
MLSIREEQMQALDAVALRGFEDEMVEHLTDFAPHHAKRLGEEGMHAVVRPALARAGKHGLTLRGPLRLYLEMVFLFGSRFDTDPTLPWAAAALGSSEEEEMARAERLYDALQDYLGAAGGPGNAHALKALERLAEQRDTPPPPAGSTFYPALMAMLEHVYPQKAAYAGERAMRTLAARAYRQARARGLASPEGVMLFAALMFAMGHGFAVDPLFPWARNTLENPALRDPPTRIERLRSKSLTYLDQVLAHVKKEA